MSVAGNQSITTIQDVIDRLSQFPNDPNTLDGVGSFNQMYLEVTESVDRNADADDFTNLEFMTNLDVVFAKLYFEALDAGAAGDVARVPKAWRPLFARRYDPKIAHVQFALAGMNAHINHDLPLAVVGTCELMGLHPGSTGLHSDYDKINKILADKIVPIRRSFEDAEMLELDKHLTTLFSMLGCWGIDQAREAAWDSADMLWMIRRCSMFERAFSYFLAYAAERASDWILDL